ncbi:MAG: NAD-dependent epimerase/dehydratase family protein [Pseudomonadota bacterium]
MRVLIIGATGFIGPYVVKHLLKQNHQLAVLHRGQTRADFPAHVQAIQADRNQLSGLRDALIQFKPDVVLDVIPYTAQQAQTLIQACSGLVPRVIALSSADVYRNYDGLRGQSDTPPDPVPLLEDSPLRETRYPYRGAGLGFEWADDYDKILVEQIIMDAPALAGTILRLPAVYGPGDKQHRLRQYLKRMDNERPTILLSTAQANWRWTWGYVENVAEAIALAVTSAQAAGRIYNIGEDLETIEQEWVMQIGQVVGWTGEVMTLAEDQLPKHLRKPMNFQYELLTDTRRIRQELGYQESINRPEALRRTIEWERGQPDNTPPPDYAAEGEG